jgi:hypothetical protein
MSHTAASHEQVEAHDFDDVKVGKIVYWGFLSVAITVLAIMLLHALYSWYFDGQMRAKSLEYDARHEFAATELARQEGELTAAPRWYDDAKSMVAIPIDRAIEMTLEEYQQPTANTDQTPAE